VRRCTGCKIVDCRIVATLIGKKIVLNEFLAYIDLGILIKEERAKTGWLRIR
jgi:nucleoside permease NupC